MYEMDAELMILGFISLLLTFGEKYILKICIPEKAAAYMLPCSAPSLTHDQDKTGRLAAATTSSPCDEVLSLASLLLNFTFSLLFITLFCFRQGHEPLISVTGLHQLHILLFFMAVFHILYSFITMMLGRLKVRQA